MRNHRRVDRAAYRGAPDGLQYGEMPSPPTRLGERGRCYINAMIQLNFILLRG